MILFSNGHDNYIIEEFGSYYTQRKLRQLQNKIVRFVMEDPSPSSQGFYVVCSEDYDTSLDMQHTHRKNFAL